MLRPLAIPAILALLASRTQAADNLVLKLSNNSPAQCDTLGLSWTGGTPNYTILITAPADQYVNQFQTVPVLDAFNLVNTSFTWTADRCGGDNIKITASDSGGFQSIVTFTLKTSTNTSCLSYSQQESCFITSTGTSSPPSSTTQSAASEVDSNNRATVQRTIIIVVVIVAVFVALMVARCVYVRVRRRRNAGILRLEGGTSWRGGTARQDIIGQRLPPYAPPQNSQSAPPNYSTAPIPQSPSSAPLLPPDPIHSRDRLGETATGPVQMSEIPRPVVQPELGSSDATRETDAAGGASAQQSYNPYRPRNGEARVASTAQDDDVPPPAYSEI